VYVAAHLRSAGKGLTIEVEIAPHARSRPWCSGCGRRGSGYDRLASRRFAYVPLWNIPVFFVYAMRRVDCARCGVTVEMVPWSEGKQHITRTYAWFLAGWAKRMSWQAVADAFQVSWESVFRSVEMAVDWGRRHMLLDRIEAIGVDEILWRKGYRFLTLVYQIDEGRKRLLWIGRERQVKTLLGFFRWLGPERSARLRFICSDMWKPYLRVIAKKAGQAIHVLDRFHIVSHLNKAIDEVRAQEARGLKASGYQPILTRTRWLLLKRRENLTEQQDVRLADLLRYNLRSVRAYLLKEQLQLLWRYVSPYHAGRFLDQWCTRALRSRIEPIKKVARMLRSHRRLLLNWFRARGQVSAGSVEGFNNKAKVITRRAFGFRTFRAAEIALYHGLGALPEPNFTHRFC
jgi:transposase